MNFKAVFLFFFILAAQGQERPPIENFTPIDYGAQNQNWGISQSKQKDIYVANNGGLLAFNGAHWNLYGSPNGSAIRSVRALNDLVYTGCYMEFGFWKKNESGILVYSSISQSVEIPLLEDEEFWNILDLDEWVLFQSLERIYIYNTIDQSVNVIDSKSTKAHMFNVNGTIYFHRIGKGLFKIDKGRSFLVSDDAIVQQNVVSGMFELQNKTLLVTENGAFYFIENDGLRAWKITSDEALNAVNVYSSLQLADGSIVLGTISNGILHIGVDGEMLQEINQERGLNNNTVLSIFEDKAHNLWLAMDNGLSVVNLYAPFKEYIDKNGKIGVVYASALFEDYLYLGTNQGLFYKETRSDDNFKLMAGTEGQVWVLKVHDNTLFCGHNNGTYVVNSTTARLISEFPGTWNIKPIPNRKDLLLQGNFNGLSVLKKNDDQWQLRNEISGFDISSRFYEFVDASRLLVNHEFKGVFTLNLNADYTTVKEVKNEAPKGVGASLVKYLDKILYTCDSGIYAYDQSTEAFAIDSVLTKFFYAGDDDPIGIFNSDRTSKRLWCFTSDDIAYATPSTFNNEPKVNRISIPSQVRKNLGVLGFESLTAMNNDNYLIGISNGYLRVDLNKLDKKEYTIQLNTVALKSYDTELKNIPLADSALLKFEENNLFFSYHVPEYDKYTEVVYSYQLKGIYNDWSGWTNTSYVSFDNLPYGNYTFNVRAMVGNVRTINTMSYQFRIERPWYLSNLAIFIYVLSLTLLALLIHKLYKNYYSRQREQLLRENKKNLKRKKLKAQKKIVQIKNEKLQEEVASKSRELAISTMSIIKKNEFLNAIKEQLKTSNDSPQIKAVIRTIDRNINNDDDWKFFEDAFNNADKDFLRKIKSVHPELTANDLRLCAYLRLNLSSKEIAPLLNISVRSVEVKRYRLRKKINLPHENSLTDYIMEL